ncbi:hypothetical protein YDYSG_27470 [Paenibacillus tyrfis]|uniref:hypothetical protein n=1 Tax=Paenibacillus tyrfis TaxID=1501230 RepID=UPI002492A6B5|nr:hypothetical protein [Paenibacillus tyrfis]GLI06717.1 hypothetical protein YDYSG_27470 [Paenibacillus tyrfis]
MADEVLGNIYEVVTLVAIKYYTDVIKENETLFWNESPNGVSVIPDITIGYDKDKPRVLFLVSHTNAESASQKKFWRNIGEFVEARNALGKNIFIGNIMFDSGQKRQLSYVSKKLFDGFIELEDKKYGGSLISICQEITKIIIKNKIDIADRIEYIHRLIISNNEMIEVIKEYAGDLEKLTTHSLVSKRWFDVYNNILQKKDESRTPSVMVTSVRRGLGRLLPIESESQLRDIINAAKMEKPIEVPEYFKMCKLVDHRTHGFIISDREILDLINLLSVEEILEYWKLSRNSSIALKNTCHLINSTKNFTLFHKFVLEHFDRLSTNEGLVMALEECFYHPNRFLGDHISLENAWLFDYIMTIIKAHSGKQQGYGYTPLAKESGLLVPGKRSILDFVLPKYISRESLPAKYILSGISNALINKLKKIGATWLANNSSNVSEFYLRGLFEDKIYKMASFDPLKLIIETNLTSTFEYFSRFPTLLTEFTNGGVATTGIILSKSTAIIWQSASKGHCNDKMKELMGRIAMLKVKLDSTGDEYIAQPKFKKILLVIDGDWKERHINNFIKVGADGVFYPNEMHLLNQQVV